jgi:hypothetical protein
MRLALALFLCAGTAAASPKPFHCSAQGGRQWHEVKSAHFIVDTDAAGSALSTLVQSLENYLAKEIFTLLGGPADLPGRLRVVAFSSPSEFGGMGGGASGGYYWHSDLYGPYIVLPLVGFTADGETVAHELAHHVSFFSFRPSRIGSPRGSRDGYKPSRRAIPSTGRRRARISRTARAPVTRRACRRPI